MRKKKALAAGGIAATIAAGAVAGTLAFGAPALAEGTGATTSQAEAPTVRPERPGHVRKAHFLKPAAEKLGMSPEQLAQELRQGKTIADVARERHVDPQVVIDALIAQATEHIDKSVEQGRLDQEQAARLKQALPERIADLVHHGKRPGHHPGKGRFTERIPA
jgi:hypothetical protein